mgnify:CR=1 FL=1
MNILNELDKLETEVGTIKNYLYITNPTQSNEFLNDTIGIAQQIKQHANAIIKECDKRISANNHKDAVDYLNANWRESL